MTVALILAFLVVALWRPVALPTPVLLRLRHRLLLAREFGGTARWVAASFLLQDLVPLAAIAFVVRPGAFVALAAGVLLLRYVSECSRAHALRFATGMAADLVPLCAVVYVIVQTVFVPLWRATG